MQGVCDQFLQLGALFLLDGGDDSMVAEMQRGSDPIN